MPTVVHGNSACCYAELAVSSLPVAETITSTHFAYPRSDGQAELTWLADYMPRWFSQPKTVTHPSTNRALRRVTLLIETNALRLNHAAVEYASIKQLACQITARYFKYVTCFIAGRYLDCVCVFTFSSPIRRQSRSPRGSTSTNA